MPRQAPSDGEGESVFERGHENGAASEVFAAGFAQDGQDFTHFEVVRVHAVDASLPFADTFGHGAQVLLKGAAKLFLDAFPFDGAQAGDLIGEGFVPVAQGGFGDIELGGDDAEADAAGAELDEEVAGFVGVGFHGKLRVEG